MRIAFAVLLVVTGIALGIDPATAQRPATTQVEPLAVGTTAPDFTLAGATRYGVLARPIRLSDFRGRTVVLAFFYKARTKG